MIEVLNLISTGAGHGIRAIAGIAIVGIAKVGLSSAQVVDDYGDLLVTETSREVFARIGSIGQKEFYQAHAVGLQPELRFILSDYLDYDGEQLVGYNGQRYRVLRTYRAGQGLELVCYREVNPA